MLQPDDKVLELCCGTGAQSLAILDRLGNSGQLAALDISRDSLNTLGAKALPHCKNKLTLIEGGIDDLSTPLRQAGFFSTAFDLIFCAYGLYYSADALAALSQAYSRLKPDGRIVIVGPFGPNNKPLFDLVRASGVSIPVPVIVSSERFMAETVLPWGAEHFESVSVHSMVNRLNWPAPERVLNYWQNTTFYDPQRRRAFESLLDEHFTRHSEFVNEKWVMMAEMTHARR
jgi:ubiquinone/menaquinone biosynthesis C-methylase UbiE